MSMISGFNAAIKMRLLSSCVPRNVELGVKKRRFVFSIRRTFIGCSFARQQRETKNKPPNYVATPIFYVNAAPHIGHLYTTVYADALSRFGKLVDPESEHVFSTGTDEHGLKVQRSAEAKNQDTLLYCDIVSKSFYNLFEKSDVSFTVYNRTTDNKHKRAVQSLWNVLHQKGFIYKSSYEGYYSVNDESFVPENCVQINSHGIKVSTETGNPVEWHAEENYMFRLSALHDKLVDWIENRLIMKPENFHLTLKAEMRNLNVLRDLSISRSKSRLKWGIEVPDDSSQVIYVWLDALVNYLTAVGYPDRLQLWPPCHVIGKDILKFHAIYWPAFLIAADIQPPDLIYCHSHWLYEHQKMSKSKGNVVDPNECIVQFTSDGIRFFLLKEGTPHSDSNFSIEKVKICLNADLANTFGNLLNRCTSLKLNSRQHFPYYDIDYVQCLVPEAKEIIKTAQSLAATCYSSYLDGNFYIGISQIMDFLRMCNTMMTITQPWTMVNSVKDQDRLDTILYVSLEAIRIASVLLQPIIPEICESVLDKLNVEQNMRSWNSVTNGFSTQRPSVQLSLDKYVLYSKLR